MKGINNGPTLFEDFTRIHAGRANHDSSQYDFLNVSAWKAATYVRNKLNEWVLDFPLDKDFIARFTSANNKEHNAAFFELVMFQWLKQQNLDVEFQGIAVPGSGRRPDFTLSKNGSKIFISECTLSALPGNDAGTEKHEKQITDIVESIPCPNYFINIDFEKSSQATIPKRKLIKFLENVINEGQDKNVSVFDRREWTLQESGWRINFSLFFKSSSSTRTLGATTHGAAQIINSERPLRTALDRKRGRNYGSQQMPYIICINSFDFYLDDISIMQTLFGTSGEISLQSNEAGFLIHSGKPQNTSVAAILILKGLVPWNLHAVRMGLWHNPWATYPLITNLLDVDQNSYKVNERGAYEPEFINGKTLGEILSIDHDYLSQEIE